MSTLTEQNGSSPEQGESTGPSSPSRHTSTSSGSGTTTSSWIKSPFRRFILVGAINYAILNAVMFGLNLYTGDSFDRLVLRAGRSLAVIAAVSETINEAMPTIVHTLEDLNQVATALNELKDGESTLEDILPTIGNALDDLSDFQETIDDVKDAANEAIVDSEDLTLDDVIESISNTLDNVEHIGSVIDEVIPDEMVPESISNTLHDVKNVASTLGDVTDTISDVVDEVRESVPETIEDASESVPDEASEPAAPENDVTVEATNEEL